MKPRPSPLTASELVLSNPELAWAFSWNDGRLVGVSFENKLTRRAFPLSGSGELALVFSAATDRVAEPFLRADDFAVRAVRRMGRLGAVFTLHSLVAGLEAKLHVQLDGPTRRKWVELTNTAKRDLLLLDVELDDFTFAGTAAGGGSGQPVFLDDEVFAAIEHPAGENTGAAGRVRLAHFPGHRLAPRAKFRSHVALVSVAAAGQANADFLDYIQSRSRPRPKFVSTYTPFGINNQWGACPTLDDEQALAVLDRVAELRKKGAPFDYFTLDTGWVDYGSDLTQFKPTAFPDGPGKIVARVRELRMKFGLWFATSWGLQSCWDYPGAFADGKPPTQLYREGYPLGAEGIMFCLGEENYFSILKKAVLHHVRENGVRFLKFDGGAYRCDSIEHGHLPGKYSVEPMFAKLIDIADSARAIAPDVFIMWYWGLRSPFWALHGDAIFESGLFMEGSGTSSTPTLYYRDSVTLAQDQNAQHAKTIPPRLKDSLGVWLSDTRWGNFMGAERWRETLVMDLGRGSRLFPNLWGNLHDLSDDDVAFLAWITALARKNAALFQSRKTIPGDPFRNDVYGYAHARGSRGFLFFHNAHFTARRGVARLDASLGFTARAGTPVRMFAHFPDKQQLRRPDGTDYRVGDTLDVWLRPFETLMLEVAPAKGSRPRLPLRSLTDAQAAQFGSTLALTPTTLDPRMDLRFAEAAAFEQKKFAKKTYAFESALPALAAGTSVLAIVVRLRKGEAEWKYAPTVVQIVQALVRIGGRNVPLIPVPDGRQHGNTQSFGCSWLVWKVRLSSAWTGQPLQIAVHANLPEDVEAHVEGWVVHRWWQEDHRPTGDGYYTYAPS
jgi:hypothetical protein